MMKGWTCPKTVRYTERHDAIAEEYRNGTSVAELKVKYGLSKTWIYHVIYCYGLSKRTRLTERCDPLNYSRLKRYLKRKGQINHKSEGYSPVP